MSYATIEEAWGGLGKQISKVVEKPFVQKPVAKQPQTVPRAGVTFDDGRKYVRAVYAQYGIKGIIELLGVDISKRLCGHGGGKTNRRQYAKKADWFDALTPEKMMLILAILFGAVFLLDGFSGASLGGGSSSPPPW